MNELLGILFLATLVEGLIQYLFGEKDEHIAPRWYLRYLSLIVGVGLAIAYKVNVPEMVGLNSDYIMASYIVSGIIIGRGSNYVNDLVGKFKKK